MKAGIRKGLLSASTWSFTTTHPKPSFNPTQNQNSILIKVHAAGINPVDYKLPKPISGPVIGLDVSGVVEDIGDQVTDFEVGDEVFGKSFGSLAEYTIASCQTVAKKSSHLTFVEAAGLPCAYVTSLQALRIGKVSQDSSVLIIGASGGCGMAALHLCKGLGVKRVVAICSGKNADLVKEAGATEVVDYTQEEELKTFFEKNEGKFHCVYDAATGSGKGEDYTAHSLPLLISGNGEHEKHGEYVQLNGGPLVWFNKALGRQTHPHRHLLMVDVNTADLQEVSSLLEKGGCRPLVARMELTEEGVKEGLQRLQSRRTKGKLVYEFFPPEERK